MRQKNNNTQITGPFGSWTSGVWLEPTRPFLISSDITFNIIVLSSIGGAARLIGDLICVYWWNSI